MDPFDIPGLAHLCEHMLFMGTDRYKNFLSLHRGFSNAFTSNDHTNFYFDVAPDSFSHALYMLVFVWSNKDLFHNS